MCWKFETFVFDWLSFEIIESQVLYKINQTNIMILLILNFQLKSAYFLIKVEMESKSSICGMFKNVLPFLSSKERSK